MVLDEQAADIIALIMAAISVSFMVPALAYAYLLRNKITKTLLILAASRNVYKYLFMVLGFAAIASVAHLVYHIGEFGSLPLELELIVHIIIDASFILVAVSLFLTFKTAYGMLTDEKAKSSLEKIFRDAASNISREESSHSDAASAH
jgi:hypothetical protein